MATQKNTGLREWLATANVGVLATINPQINTDGIFNAPSTLSWSACGLGHAFLGVFPDMADDSYATINLTGPASESGAGSADPSIVEDANLSPTVSGYFIGGGTELNVNTLTGASWYVLNTAANALPTSDRWLIAQVTTAGSISGQINYQIFPLGVGADQVQMSVTFVAQANLAEPTTWLTDAGR